GAPSMVWKRKPASAARARQLPRSAIATRFTASTADAVAATTAAAEATTARGHGTVGLAGHRRQAGLAGTNAAAGVRTTSTPRGGLGPAIGLVPESRLRCRRCGHGATAAVEHLRHEEAHHHRPDE